MPSLARTRTRTRTLSTEPGLLGEAGLLEGRTERNTTVRCATPVELLAVDKATQPSPTPSPSP